MLRDTSLLSDARSVAIVRQVLQSLTRVGTDSKQVGKVNITRALAYALDDVELERDR